MLSRVVKLSAAVLASAAVGSDEVPSWAVGTTCKDGMTCPDADDCCPYSAGGYMCCKKTNTVPASTCCGGGCCEEFETCCSDDKGSSCCVQQTTKCAPKSNGFPARCCPRWTVGCTSGSVGCCDPAQPWQWSLATDRPEALDPEGLGQADWNQTAWAASAAYALFVQTSTLHVMKVDVSSGRISHNLKVIPSRNKPTPAIAAPL
jgi:hypothetical protein